MTKLKRRSFNRRKLIYNMTTTAVLSALGAVLMVIGHYFAYPVAPFLKLEPSDTVVLVAFALCGFPSALCTAVIKTLIDLMIHGMTGAYAVGQIIALCTSLCYVLGIFLCSKVLRLFSKGIAYRMISYTITIILVSTVMTLLNYLIFTPIFLTGEIITCFDPRFQVIFEDVNFPFKGPPFIIVVLLLYLPFNLLKGAIVCAFYELIFNRLIFRYFKRSDFYNKIQHPVENRKNDSEMDGANLSQD